MSYPYLAEPIDAANPVVRSSALLAAISKILHPSSPGASLPATANFIGELFVKNSGGLKRGTYASLDLVGNWSGPIK